MAGHKSLRHGKKRVCKSRLNILQPRREWQAEGPVPKVRGLGLQGCSHVTPRKVILQPVMMKKPFTKGTPDSVT